LSGAAIVTLAGRASSLELDLSGASELRGAKLQVSELDIDGSGGSMAIVRAGHVRGSLSGGSRLRVGADAQGNVKVSSGAGMERRL
jgi:hypothetical protein